MTEEEKPQEESQQPLSSTERLSSHATQQKQNPKQKRSFKKGRTIVIALICAGLIFAGGIMVGMNNALQIQLGFPVVMGEGGPTIVGSESTEIARRVVEVSNMLDREGLSPSDLEKATDGALNGLLASTDDVYAHYYPPKDYKYMMEDHKGQFGGIGVVLSEKDGQAYVVKVYENTPAERAGMQPGDIILAVNGERKDPWSVQDVVNAVRTEPGTEVTITWASVDDQGARSEEKEATLVTEEIQYPVVSHQMMGDLGVITISKFNSLSAQEVKFAIQEVTNQGAKGIVLDLRGNPGGPLAQAVAVSSEFIKSGTIVETKSKATGTQKETANGDVVTDLPLVVLVDQDSASTAEIVTAAIQDHERGLIVGDLTYGKGSVQIIHDLSFGGGVKFTIAHYFTPDGHEVDQLGVLPDLIVPMDRKLKNVEGQDVQMTAALDALEKIIANEGNLAIEGLSNEPGAQPELTKEAREVRAAEMKQLAQSLQEAEKAILENAYNGNAAVVQQQEQKPEQAQPANPTEPVKPKGQQVKPQPVTP